MRYGIESPFSFRLAEKKTAIHGQKKRRCIQTCGRAQVWGNGFCENCCESESVHTESRAWCGFCPTLYAALIKLQTSGCKEDTPCFSFRCRSCSFVGRPALSEAESAESCAESGPILHPSFQPHLQLRERTPSRNLYQRSREETSGFTRQSVPVSPSFRVS